MIEQRTAPAPPAEPPYVAMWVTTLVVFPLLEVLSGVLVAKDPFALVLVFLYPYTAAFSVITFLPSLLSGWWAARRVAVPGLSELALLLVAVAVHYVLFACGWAVVVSGKVAPAVRVVPGALAILLFLGWIACRTGGVNAKK